MKRPHEPNFHLRITAKAKRNQLISEPILTSDEIIDGSLTATSTANSPDRMAVSRLKRSPRQDWRPGRFLLYVW